MSKTAIIIANTGSPDDPSPDALKRYLAQFLSNKRIVPMNRVLWSLLLKLVILPKRSVTSGTKYQTIWNEGFQFIRDHQLLAQRLEQACNESGVDVRVECAMSFGKPSLEHAMSLLAEEGHDSLVVVPLYPQHAFSQAGIVSDEVERLAPLTGWEGRYCVTGDYSANADYLDAICTSILHVGYNPNKDRLLFSFHSIPLVDIAAGDTYGSTVQQTCESVALKLHLKKGNWMVAYQSRFDKGRTWLSPFVGDVLARWADDPWDGSLYVVCPNFSVDCLETYYDVDRIMRQQWQQLQTNRTGSGMVNPFIYVPCLGASQQHVMVLKSVLHDYVF